MKYKLVCPVNLFLHCKSVGKFFVAHEQVIPNWISRFCPHSNVFQQVWKKYLSKLDGLFQRITASNSSTNSSKWQNFELAIDFMPVMVILWTQETPPAAEPFRTQGPPFEQTFQKLIRQCFIPNINDLGILVSQNNNFKSAPYVSLFQTSVHPGEVIFGPRDFIWTILVEVY